ncbi:MAG: hypothetical protein ABEL76_01280, partial [Bradymonadaceae bacterium]
MSLEDCFGRFAPGRSAWLAASVTLALAAGCGGGGGFQSDDVPAVRFRGTNVSGNKVKLILPKRNGRQSDTVQINVASTGAAPLKIQDVELKNRPDRLLYLGEQTDRSCDFEATDDLSNDASGNCRAGEFCMQDLDQCRSRKLPDSTIKVAPGASEGFTFRIAATPGTRQPGCPEPPSSVPSSIGDSYCGEFIVETNAQTSNSRFEKGKGRIYLTTPTANKAGKIKVSESSITFSNVAPGYQRTKQLTISNTAASRSSATESSRSTASTNAVASSPAAAGSETCRFV